jgi:hypothetical protein
MRADVAGGAWTSPELAMPMPPKVAHARAKKSALTRHRPPGDPDLAAASLELESVVAEDRITRAVLEIVEQAPLLSARQRDSLAVLLRGGS